MQIVMEIPEDVLGFVYINGFIKPEDRNTVNHAILECIELPKKHGRLIDADQLMKDYGNPDVKILLDNMDTIIEADKEE